MKKSLLISALFIGSVAQAQVRAPYESNPMMGFGNQSALFKIPEKIPVIKPAVIIQPPVALSTVNKVNIGSSTNVNTTAFSTRKVTRKMMVE